MHLDLLDIDKFAENLKEVTFHKIDEGGKLSKNGLFSQQIFGPINSYKCACPRSPYRGPHSNEEECSICNVKITSSEARRTTFAKINLPFPIINPVFYNLVLKTKPSAKAVMDGILFFRLKVYIDSSDNSLKKLEDGQELTEGNKLLLGIDGVIDYIKYLDSKENKKELKFILKNINMMKIHNVLIIPPEFRNFTKTSNGKYMIDELNRIYKEIIMRSNRIKKLPYNLTEEHDVYRAYFKSIQNFVFDLYNYIFERLSKKKGLIRGNILGKRVDFSGRAVISPNPLLHINECKIPYLIALEILKPQLTAYLVNRKICSRYNQAVSMIEESYKKKTEDLFDIVEEFCEGKICILNRQPSLHRTSILAFKMGIHRGKTIQVHPLHVVPFGADYDGDNMAIYIPVTDIAIKDATDKLAIWHNLISATDGTLVTKFNQDICLGLYLKTLK
jgi:DNA-directed RNA polymerase subunit beta'